MNAETIKKLREIKRHILEEPKRLDMGTYLDCKGQRRRKVWPTCGTVGCIAGWAVVLQDGPRKASSMTGSVHDRAAEILGLTRWQAQELFLGQGSFPEQGNPQTRAYARAVARRIERFIATDGAE